MRFQPQSRFHSSPKISHIGKRSFEGVLIRATTKGGHSFRSSPNHIVFARFGAAPNLHYVYLMYRKDKGTHGIASHTRSDGTTERKIGLQVRCNQENADEGRVLKSATIETKRIIGKRIIHLLMACRQPSFMFSGRRIACRKIILTNYLRK